MGTIRELIVTVEKERKRRRRVIRRYQVQEILTAVSDMIYKDKKLEIYKVLLRNGKRRHLEKLARIERLKEIKDEKNTK